MIAGVAARNGLTVIHYDSDYELIAQLERGTAGTHRLSGCRNDRRVRARIRGREDHSRRGCSRQTPRQRDEPEGDEPGDGESEDEQVLPLRQQEQANNDTDARGHDEAHPFGRELTMTYVTSSTTGRREWPGQLEADLVSRAWVPPNRRPFPALRPWRRAIDGTGDLLRLYVWQLEPLSPASVSQVAVAGLRSHWG